MSRRRYSVQYNDYENVSSIKYIVFVYFIIYKYVGNVDNTTIRF